MKLVYAGFTLLFIGMILLMLASISSTTTIPTQSSSGYAGVIFLGPIPIMFAGGNPSQLPFLMSFALIFTIIGIILFFILPLILSRKSRSRF